MKFPIYPRAGATGDLLLPTSQALRHSKPEHYLPRVGMGAAGQAVRLPVTLAAPKHGVERASSPKFLPSTGPNQKPMVLYQALAKLGIPNNN